MAACHPSPAGWLLTDPRLARYGLDAARCLPPGSAVIVRSDMLDPRTRHALVLALRRVATVRNLHLFVAGVTPQQAWRLGADGLHIRTRSRQQAQAARRLGLATSAPVHNRSEARAVAQAGIEHALISPLFATRSHPGAPTLTIRQFVMLAIKCRANPVALGGMTAARHRVLRLHTAAIGMNPAWAAIDGWERKRPVRPN